MKITKDQVFHYTFECGICGTTDAHQSTKLDIPTGWDAMEVVADGTKFLRCGECKFAGRTEPSGGVAQSPGPPDEASQDFATLFEALQSAVHNQAREKGWWPENLERNDAEMIALMHSELSEALEGLRADNPTSEKIPPFTSVEEELADTIIRIMDFAEARRHRVVYALIAKLEYNQSRPHRHGGKKY